MQRNLLASFLIGLFTFSGFLNINSAEAISEDEIPAVVLLATYDKDANPIATGSGFFISPDGAILTNFHVIQDEESDTGIAEIVEFCVFKDSHTSVEDAACGKTAYLAAYDENLDIALLFPHLDCTTDAEDCEDISNSFTTEAFLQISPYPAELGEDIFIYGYPSASLASGITFTEGVVSGFAEGGTYFITDATINPGNSGGPVFSYFDGKVLGIASMVTLDGVGGNYGIAISNTAIYDWLVQLANTDILNKDFVNNMFAEETGYDLGEMVFTDVEFGEANSSAIGYLKDQGILGGYPDGSFKPTQSLNRAELLKILVEGKGITPDASLTNCFPDVKNEWFAKYVCYAKQQGWIAGYPDGTFRPSSNVNKVEAIKMLLEVFNVDTAANPANGPFSDVPLGAWFTNYIHVAKQLGLLEESGENYFPSAEITRGGISENIYRLLLTQ